MGEHAFGEGGGRESADPRRVPPRQASSTGSAGPAPRARTPATRRRDARRATELAERLQERVSAAGRDWAAIASEAGSLAAIARRLAADEAPPPALDDPPMRGDAS